mgnify:CR=1 FL=1
MHHGTLIAGGMGTTQHTGFVGKEGELIRRMEAVALNWQSILDTFTKYWVQQLCALILCLITW